MVADACEMMLGNSTVVEQLAKENRSLAEKIRDWLREWVENLKIALEGLQADRTESRAMMQYAQELQEIWDNALVDAARNNRGTTEIEIRQQARVGTDEESGKPIYQANFPKGTPKAAKAQRILSLIQNVWSKKPISLVVQDADGSTRRIEARFDPTYIEEEGVQTDAKKLMGGNRHGTSGEQRVTLDLADDYYEIAAESTYNYSKSETGKSSATHEGVKQWHYFINDILFQEYGEKETTPYRVTINVKERSDGDYVYSFSAERQNERSSTRRTLHADDTQSAKGGESNAQPSVNSIRQSNDNSQEKSSDRVQNSVRDSAGRELTEAQREYFKDSKVRDADGNLLVMYHQTDGTFTVFDTKHKGAGTGDDETPFGIFLKRTPRDIGVRGKKQMELYADIRNPLRVRDRTELVNRLRELSADYARLKDESMQVDKEYSAKFEEAKSAFRNFLSEWRKNNPDAPGRAAYDAEGFDTAFDAEDNVVKEWTRAKDELALRAKTAITQALRDNGYDGVILENDKGSWGRSTEAYIALDENQVKNTTNKTPTADRDIRYSLREVGGKVMPVLDVQNDTRDYKVAEAYLKTLVDTEHPFATILVDAQPVYIGKDLPGEYKGSEYTHGLNRSTRQVKMQAATNLDEMLLLAEDGEWRENVKDKHKQDAKNGWYRYSTRFALPVLDIKKAVDHYTVYSGTLLIRNDADGKSYLYDLLDIKKEKVISSPSFSAQGRSEVFEPKPSQEQYMQNSRESQAENTGNDRQ